MYNQPQFHSPFDHKQKGKQEKDAYSCGLSGGKIDKQDHEVQAASLLVL
jgi:hypothetical protein